MQICAIIWEIIISVYILFKSTFYLDYCASVFVVIYMSTYKSLEKKAIVSK